MVIAIIIVVLAAVVYVAMGRGGELSVERNDYVPLDLGPVSATDVALLRPPAGMWGYNIQVTDEAMEQVAESIRERDVRIVALEQLVTDLSRDHAPPVPLLAPIDALLSTAPASDEEHEILTLLFRRRNRVQQELNAARRALQQGLSVFEKA